MYLIKKMLRCKLFSVYEGSKALSHFCCSTIYQSPALANSTSVVLGSLFVNAFASIVVTLLGMVSVMHLLLIDIAYARIDVTGKPLYTEGMVMFICLKKSVPVSEGSMLTRA